MNCHRNIDNESKADNRHYDEISTQKNAIITFKTQFRITLYKFVAKGLKVVLYYLYTFVRIWSMNLTKHALKYFILDLT